MCLLLVALLASSAALGASPVLPVDPESAPLKATPRPVTEELFGQQVIDRYRYMESKDAETVAWMKQQGAWSGHGLGTTKTTRDAEEADIAAAFVLWCAGLPAWQPSQ